jgi:hypothetical protein
MAEPLGRSEFFRPGDIFRPCVSRQEITITQCTADLLVPSIAAHDATGYFVLKQVMDGYRRGFDRPDYALTAMGWSYDWNPDSPTHRGV